MINRIKEIAQYYGLTSTAFADQVEIPRPVISHIFSERNRPSLEVVQKIGLAFPEVDLSWLLYGKGEMLKIVGKVDEVSEIINQPVQDMSEISSLASEQKLPLQNPIPSAKVPAENQSPINKKRAVKIVFLYDDNSFEEFLPT